MNDYVMFKLSKQDKQLLKQLAQSRRMGMSAYIRDRVLTQPGTILTAEKYEAQTEV